MHKIDKFLSKLDMKRREKTLAVLLQIRSGDLQGLDIKKLKGVVSRYRVRVGRCRITFEISRNITKIINIDLRNDNTYSF